MKITLDEAEVTRAVQSYMARKVGRPTEDLKAKIIWRGKYAEVEFNVIPTLTKEVKNVSL